MRFDFRRHDELPRLSWCAKVHRHRDSVHVLHGPWVETASDSFVEGAWDGSWAEKRFDTAVTFAGSGGRLTPEGALFCPPTHNLERLFSIRVGDDLFVSNSLVFALVQARADLDLDHPDYFFDLLRHYRTGISPEEKTLRTATGASVRLFDCVNLLVGPDLEIQPMHKRFGAAPHDFGEYVGFLEETVARVSANAADAARERRFEALTSVSRGYDSAAVSVLAARTGCRQAVTFRRSGDRTGPSVRYEPDDGTEIARCLGLEVTTYERWDTRSREEVGPAELFTNPYFSTEVSTQVMESQLGGKLWMTGRHGEQFWDMDPVLSQPWLRDPISMSMAGANSTDMRLRIGYVHFPVPYTLGVFAPALNRISRSREMAPWSVGGRYDRPIARRLLESEGVPRKLFGQRKMGGGGDSAEHQTLPPRWEEDFLAFYHAKVDPRIRSRLVEAQLGDVPYYVKGKMGRVERWLRTRPALRGIAPRLLGDRRHQRWRSRYLYAFHWGAERIRSRYSVESANPSA